MERLGQLPISRRLICELHATLLAGVRGRERSPGAIRTTQNWIGTEGATIATATFVPPPSTELDALISDWEQFANEDGPLPLLVQCALVHYQFETLHPFLDGNGRLGRLLIPLFLVARGRIDTPLLYLSPWIEQRRDAYYAHLQGVRERGDVTAWLDFVFEFIATQSDDAVQRALWLIDARDRYRDMLIGKRKQSMIALVDVVISNPIVTARGWSNSAPTSRVPPPLPGYASSTDSGYSSKRTAAPGDSGAGSLTKSWTSSPPKTPRRANEAQSAPCLWPTCSPGE